jgi:putative flippase GtrA
VGGIAAVVDISIFTIFAKLLGYNYIFIGAVSFTVATFVNYLLSIRFVFESCIRYSKRSEVVLVYVVSAVGLLMNLVVLYLCIGIFHVEKIVSKVIATGIVFFWNYFVRKYYVFGDNGANRLPPYSQ